MNASIKIATLLASIVRNPPTRVRYTKQYSLTRDEWCEYTGTRRDKLAAIFDDRATAAMHANDGAAFDAARHSGNFMLPHPADAMIDAALANAGRAINERVAA